MNENLNILKLRKLLHAICKKTNNRKLDIMINSMTYDELKKVYLKINKMNRVEENRVYKKWKILNTEHETLD